MHWISEAYSRDSLHSPILVLSNDHSYQLQVIPFSWKVAANKLSPPDFALISKLRISKARGVVTPENHSFRYLNSSPIKLKNVGNHMHYRFYARGFQSKLLIRFLGIGTCTLTQFGSDLRAQGAEN